MKKVTAILLVASIMMTVCSCGFGKKETELTKNKTELTVDNIEDYLTFSVECDSNVDSEIKTLLGIPVLVYTGEATADIEIINQTGVHFEKVTITLEVGTDSFWSSEDGDCVVYGWEFTNGNEGHVDENTSLDDAKNYKTYTVNLPYDGDWNATESLELVKYSGDVAIPRKPQVYIRVVDVSGYVIED